MDIGRELAQIRKKLEALERASRLSHASLEDTALQVYDGAGSLRAILGVQGDGTTAVNVVNGPPPPAPSPPVVTSVLGGVTAGWDGMFADGSTMPLDWARTEVHASTNATFTPDSGTLRTTIETAQGGTVVVSTDSPVYVLLVARNTSGAASAPSVIVGPFGPSPVVAQDVLDGIVTTVKLADDAVTQAKVATGAIGSTEISDSAVTTPKIVAGAVQTAQLDAAAVNASKIASGAVTTDKLDALAVTADKLAANSIIVGKIAAGAVDATAIAADAITGKTITGGTINGTTVTGGLIQTASSGERISLNDSNQNKVLVYNSSNVAINELSSRGLLVKGTTGATLWMNPNATYPQLNLYNAANTNKATVQVVEPSTGDANLEQFCGPFAASGYTDMLWRTYLTRDYATIERRRLAAGSNTVIGGGLYLDPTYANLGFKNTDNSTQDTGLTISPNLAVFNPARLNVTAPASSSSAFYVEADSAHTGNMLRLYRAADKFVVDKDGNTTVAGNLTVSGIGQRTAKRRTSDITRANTTTAAADTQITFTVDANAVYALDGFIKYSGANDFLMGWTFPTGTLGEWHGIGNGTTVMGSSGSNTLQQDTSSSLGYMIRTETTDLGATRTYGGISTNTYGIQVRGLVRVGSTGGTFALTWAQGTSGATVTTLYTDSYIRLEKVA